MNKSYRVLFNRARGCMMVVNELTSSVCGRAGKVAVTAAALVVASGAMAGVGTVTVNGNFGEEQLTDNSLTSVESDTTRLSAVSVTNQQSIKDLNVSVDVKAADKGENVGRIHAVSLVGGDLTVGNVTVNVTNAVKDAQIRAFRLNPGNLTVNGNINIKAYSTGEAQTNGLDGWSDKKVGSHTMKLNAGSDIGEIKINVGSNGNATGLVAAQSLDAEIGGSLLDVTATGGSGDAWGLDFEGGNVKVTTKKVIIKGQTTSEAHFDPITGPHPDGYGQWAMGLYLNGQGKDKQVFITSDTLDITASNDPNDNLHSASTGIRSEGNGHLVIGDNTKTSILATSHRGEAEGIWTSFYTIAKFGGQQLKVDAQSDSGVAIGFISSGVTQVDFVADNFTLNASSITGNATGLLVQNHTQGLPGTLYGTGSISQAKDLTITANGSNATGIDVQSGAAHNSSDTSEGKLTFNAGLNIASTATASNGVAKGIYLNTTPVYDSQAATGEQFWHSAPGKASVTVAGDTTMTVTGSESYGLHAVNGAQATFNGNTTITTQDGFAIYATTASEYIKSEGTKGTDDKWNVQNTVVQSGIDRTKVILAGTTNNLVGAVVVDRSDVTLGGTTQLTQGGTTPALSVTNEGLLVLNGGLTATASANGATALEVDATSKVTAMQGVTTLKGAKALAGAGTFENSADLTLDGDVKDFMGTFTQTAGSLKFLNASAYLGGTVSVNGGTLDIQNFGTDVDLSKTTVATGTLKATTGQIFTNAAADIAGKLVSDAGALKTSGVTLNGGTLSLNDAQYTLDYSSSASTLVGDTQLVFTGTLVDDSKPDGEKNQIDLTQTDVQNNGTQNTVHANATGDLTAEKNKHNLAVGELPTVGDNTTTVVKGNLA